MRRKILAGIMLIGLILTIFYFDSIISVQLFSLKTNLLDEFFLGISFISAEVIIFFFLTSLFLWNEHKRRWILPLWLTLFFSVIVSFFMKIIFHRLRPYQLKLIPTLEILQKTNHLIWNYSFPSFHTMLVFGAIPIISREFPKLKYWWIGFASLVAFSRIYFGVHFLSDVIVGGIVGYLIGIGIVKLEEKYQFGKRINGLMTKCLTSPSKNRERKKIRN